MESRDKGTALPMGPEKRHTVQKRVGVICLALTLALLAFLAAGKGFGNSVRKMADPAIMEKYDMYMTNELSDALEGVISLEKVYWLHDTDLVAPKPNPSCYGRTGDPTSLTDLLEEASALLDGQQLVFSTDVEIAQDSEIRYYLDETIFAITWKQKVGRSYYTFSEVKIQDPSQFRRFLSGGEFGSGVLYTTSDMARTVNAVTASNGDYYSFRPYGNCVYNGEVKRAGDIWLDTCYVDDKGDLQFAYRHGMSRRSDIEKFVEENNIRFSLAFGPVLIDDGKVVAPWEYPIGETDDYYSRAALCQLGPLHYMLVASNYRGVDIKSFAGQLSKMGVRNAYALDGGQTATIVIDGELANRVDYGGEREISDIIYFATAVPDGG